MGSFPELKEEHKCKTMMSHDVRCVAVIAILGKSLTLSLTQSLTPLFLSLPRWVGISTLITSWLGLSGLFLLLLCVSLPL